MSATCVATRRSHYENAFEDYLTRHRVPYVAISDVRAAVPGRLGVKAFDYIVYPNGRPPCLVDVKGRKSVAGPGRAARKWDSWVTQGDVDGMTRWRELFGPDFSAAFVFGYWMDADGRNAEPEQHTLVGRLYSFWCVEVPDYAGHSKVRSVRWKTVDLPSEQFIRLAWPASRWIRE